MLSNNLDNSMQKAMKYENLTKASKFGKAKKLKENEKSLEKEILMLQKISKYVKDDYTENLYTKQEEISEKMEESSENISFCKSKNTKPTYLPFFKSISYKLSEEFCA